MSCASVCLLCVDTLLGSCVLSLCSASPPPPTPPKTVVIMSFLLMFGGMFVIPNLEIALLVALLFSTSTTLRLVAAAVLALLVAVSFFPRHIRVQPTLIHANPLWPMWRRYFAFQVVREGPALLWAQQRGPVLIPEEPHGVFPIGQWLSHPVFGDIFPKGMFFAKCGAADIMLRIPLFRLLFAGMGVVSARREALERELAKGYNLAIIPGGVAEVFCTAMDREVVFLRQRTGFCRFALEHGLDIIPCFHLGNSATLNHLGAHGGVLMWLSRKLRLTVMAVWGRWGLPIPYAQHVVMAVGQPIRVQRPAGGGPASPEQIHALHARYLLELEGLFDRHKHRVGWQDRKLIVM